jgi:hypothetical protein
VASLFISFVIPFIVQYLVVLYTPRLYSASTHHIDWGDQILQAAAHFSTHHFLIPSPHITIPKSKLKRTIRAQGHTHCTPTPLSPRSPSQAPPLKLSNNTSLDAAVNDSEACAFPYISALGSDATRPFQRSRGTQLGCKRCACIDYPVYACALCICLCATVRTEVKPACFCMCWRWGMMHMDV